MTSVPFAATAASEWTKLTSLRSTRIVAALSVALALAATTVGAILTGRSWDSWGTAARADFDPTVYPLIGGIFASILLPILGVTAVTAEYSTGMIRLTLTATPRRGRLLLAKTSVIAAATMLVGLVTVLGMFVIGQVVYGLYGLDAANFGDGGTLRALLGSIVLAPVFPIIAVALATLLRSTAGAITTILVAIFLPSIVGSLLPDWWRENVVAVLPGPAIDTITISHLTDVESSLPTGVAVLAVAAWLGAFLGAAQLAFVRRDA
ncbi:MAG: ABC transporter permease [Gaiellaceae bacterium MAG52_C11]|nr:ABC transporter permease [Candidatus Gaiellasilicea maunaloa]